MDISDFRKKGHIFGTLWLSLTHVKSCPSTRQKDHV